MNGRNADHPAPLVLIVEDQAPIRAELKAAIEALASGPRVIEAGSGREALAHCAGERPDVVVMDVRLPDANGIELTARIHQQVPDAQIIVISAHSGPEYIQHSLLAGASAFVPKEQLHSRLLPQVERSLVTAGARPPGGPKN